MSSPEGTIRAAAHLPGLDAEISNVLASLDEQKVPSRIWRRDHTVWKDEPSEIADRMGWLTVHEGMRDEVPRLEAFAAECAAEGFTSAVLAGMGGSSLAPEVLRAVCGRAPGMLDLVVIDSTHPDQIRALQRSVDLDRTLFVIASKSGTTTETLSHLAYFWDLIPDGSRFVAITDGGTPLEGLARERAFRRCFLSPPDVGGRYSALSSFGLVPAALIGADVGSLVRGAAEMAEACRRTVPASENPGAWLGAVLGAAARMGRDKLTLVLDGATRAFGPWVEQLVAESTGKEGRGIVPVEGEDVGDPDVYGNDRVFVGWGGGSVREALLPLEHAGHPVVLVPFHGPASLGAEFFRWEFATAVAGSILGIQPFDQPNVQEAKDATRRILSGGSEPRAAREDLGALLRNVRPGDYVGIQAYLPRDEETEHTLHRARMRLRDRLKVATTVGYGPRFLHSTGQLHKGGPNTGVFIQVVDPPAEDLPVPGAPYTFGTLLAAQAAGDLQSLRSRGRRVARVPSVDLEGI
jgi:transaldolase / glucose-6-phosphate isomerase